MGDKKQSIILWQNIIICLVLFSKSFPYPVEFYFSW